MALGTTRTSGSATPSRPARRSKVRPWSSRRTKLVVVEPGWSVEMTAERDLILTRGAARGNSAPREKAAVGSRPDPVPVEVFGNLFMGDRRGNGRSAARHRPVREHQGAARLSCAIFDDAGQLVANAPHVPVHLGSMESAVETVIRERGHAFAPGDVYMLNAPYAGGTHLPGHHRRDARVSAGRAKPSFYAASRGHHADIGGTAPGSMSPDATVDRGGGRLHRLRAARARRQHSSKPKLATSHARSVLRRETRPRTSRTSRPRWPRNARGRATSFNASPPNSAPMASRAYMRHVQDNAEEAVRQLIGRLRRRTLPRRDRRRLGHRGHGHHRPRAPLGQGGLHGHLAAAALERQRPRTRRPRAPCSTSSAFFSTRRSRSTRAA